VSDVACFLLTPLDVARRGLRRFTYSNTPNQPLCNGKPYGHGAIVWLDEIPLVHEAGGGLRLARQGDDDVRAFMLDKRWPTQCERCGWIFVGQVTVEEQVFWQAMYARGDGGPNTTLRDAPGGAMWFADWILADGDDCYRGPDGHCLIVKLPNGHEWTVDSRASNCDSPCATCKKPYHEHRSDAASGSCCRFVESRPHKCWVRHGEAPLITVDKQGITCNAGAGSIQGGDWHGFLRGGRLVQ
jgi:hypothetical protein